MRNSNDSYEQKGIPFVDLIIQILVHKSNIHVISTSDTAQSKYPVSNLLNLSIQCRITYFPNFQMLYYFFCKLIIF